MTRWLVGAPECNGAVHGVIHGVRKRRLGSGVCNRRLSADSLRTDLTGLAEREGLPLHTTYSNVSFSAEKTWIPGSLEACYAP